jgi:hypothetical protein
MNLAGQTALPVDIRISRSVAPVSNNRGDRRRG